jgi:hypothetical protein
MTYLSVQLFVLLVQLGNYMQTLERPKRKLLEQTKPKSQNVPKSTIPKSVISLPDRQPFESEKQNHLSTFTLRILTQLKDATEQNLTTASFKDFTTSYIRSHPVLNSSHKLKVIYLPKIFETLHSYEFNTETSYRRTTFYQAFRKLLQKNQLSFELQQMLSTIMGKYIQSMPNSNGIIHGFEQFDEQEIPKPIAQKPQNQPKKPVTNEPKKSEPVPVKVHTYTIPTTPNAQISQLIQNLKAPYNGERVDSSSYSTFEFGEYLLNSNQYEKKEIRSFGKLLSFALKDPYNSINNDKKGLAFVDKIEIVTQELAATMKPQGLNILQQKLRKYIFLTHKHQSGKQKKETIEQKLETKDLKSLQKYIEKTNLEQRLSTTDLLSYLFSHNSLKDENVVRYMMSQSDFINKSLNRSAGKVQFINQVGFLMGELRNPITKAQFLDGLNSYVFSKMNDTSNWDEETPESDWAVDNYDETEAR